MLKKLFSWGSPAQEGFFAVTLCFFWALAAPLAPLLFVSDLSSAMNSLAVLFALLIPEVLFALYLLCLYCFYSPGGMRNLPFKVLYCLAVPVVMFFWGWVVSGLLPRGVDSDQLTLAVLTVLIFWGGPLAFAPRSWKWGLLTSAAWSGALLCVAAVLNSSILDFDVIGFFGWRGEVGLSGRGWLSHGGPWLFNIVLVAGVLLLFAAWLSTGRLYAAVGGVQFRKLFTARVFLVVGAAAAVWFMSFVMALCAVYGASRTRAALARHFGRPLAVEELGKLYFKHRRPDAAYWQKFLESSRRMNESLSQPLGLSRDVPAYDEELPEAVLAEWRDRVSKNSDLTELERLCDTDIPAYNRVYRAGGAGGVWLDDLAALRNFCRFEVWRLRFAAEAGDREEALAALRRFDRAIAYIEKDNWRIAALLCRAVEELRLYAWERLIASGILTADDLRDIAHTAETAEKRMPEQSFRALYAEAVCVADGLAEFHRHLRLYTPDKEEHPPLDFRLFSWLYPSWRYRLARLEDTQLRCFLIRDWRDGRTPDRDSRWSNWIFRADFTGFADRERELRNAYRSLRAKLVVR